jgi:hypothetical protein
VLTAKAQRPLRLRTVSLEEHSRLRPVNGTSAGRSLKAENKKPIPFLRIGFDLTVKMEFNFILP